MKTSLPRGFALLVSLLAAAPILHAHPGHDENDLTWDFSHLATYPLATAGCLVVPLAAGVVGWYFLRRCATLRIQSFRQSQPSRGK